MRLFFEVWYPDDTILRGETVEDWTAMPEDILVVREVTDRPHGQPPKHACKRWAGRDYFWMTEDGEFGAGSAPQIPDDAITKRGIYVDDETWMQIYNAACVDPLIESEL